MNDPLRFGKMSLFTEPKLFLCLHFYYIILYYSSTDELLLNITNLIKIFYNIMTITINDKEIELKQTIRSLLIYENIKGESYQPKSLNDILLYLYCVVIASSGDYSFSYDNWIDWVDEHPDELTQIVQFIQQTQETQNNIKKNKTKKKA